MSKEAKILTAILVVIVGGMIALFTLGGGGSVKPEVADSSKLVRENSHKQGTGSVQMVEFGDYQCPSCGAAFPIIQRLQTEYAGKLQLVFRHFPLTQLHKNAMAAAFAAEAAGSQGKYFEMHEKLYSNQDKWSELPDPTESFVGYAREIGLDVEKFTNDLKNQTGKSAIEADQKDGTDLQIQGTPTIYINGVKQEAFDYDTLKKSIDSALNGK
jgi:protein-disulfide isomerase